MPRPLVNKGIEELESLFAQNRSDTKVLHDLQEELSHRHTRRAQRLLQEVQKALEICGEAPSTSNPPELAEPLLSEAMPEDPVPEESGVTGSSGGGRRVQPTSGEAPLPDDRGKDWKELVDEAFPLPPATGGKSPAGGEPPRPIRNRPDDILDAWLSWEVLSPQTYRKPEDLVDGDRRRIADFSEGPLPWENGLENPRPKTRLFYQIVLGAVRMERASHVLLRAFQDEFADELPQTKDHAALAVVTVDREGRPAAEGCVAVSSFAWGVPIAACRDLPRLRDWPEKEAELNVLMAAWLRDIKDENGELRPLTRDDIGLVFGSLSSSLKIPKFLLVQPTFAVRVYQWSAISDPPEPLLLNSFFVKDLALSKKRYLEGSLGKALIRYLGREYPANRIDFLKDGSALDEMVAPSAMPVGRWPAPHSMFLLQQAAVNTTFRELKDCGILGVNGPPGTGKTTLLRDVVAGIIIERCRHLAAFDDPEGAFEFSGQRIKAGQAFCHLYRVEPTVRGYEILVASSNNKAVENISRELPGRDQIASIGLEYFKSVSDAVANVEKNPDAETWGLIAAVLGNAANMSTFRKAVWKNDDTSLNHYFRAASGNEVPPITRQDPETGETTTRLPHILDQERPPAGKAASLKAWEKARREFRSALAVAEKQLRYLEQQRTNYRSIPSLQTRVGELQSRLAQLARLIQQKESECRQASDEVLSASRKVEATATRAQDHEASRPGFFSRLFGTARWRRWQTERTQLHTALQRHRGNLVSVQARDNRVRAELTELKSREGISRDELALLLRQLSAAEAALKEARLRVRECFVDDEFWEREHNSRQKSVPWLPPDVQAIRTSVFEAAIRLQKAFLDAAAKPVRHNLMALFSVFLGKRLGSPAKEILLPDLWATLFLVTPVVSTTFASVHRMLGRLPVESLGWLLIDEAGQAVPQAAVGALMRSRRAVIVGDPKQIEPVVAMPSTLISAICREFGVDPDIWAVDASVQTIADAGSRYQTELETEFGSTTIGLPLLVHRRCAEPMFSISNRVAYGGLMVRDTPARESEIERLLGPSRWIDLRGSGTSKWCPEEGRVVLEMLKQLAESELESPDIFVISPFRVVRTEMRDLVRRNQSAFSRWSENMRSWTNDRIGTIHTFQGREAEAVILLLGAPNAEQIGARNWAGGRPNLLNVAATRAKSAFYVVGSRQLWKQSGCFGRLDYLLT